VTPGEAGGAPRGVVGGGGGGAAGAAVRVIDAVCAWVGRVSAWMTLAMVLMTFVVVVLRYGFEFGRIWMHESSTWMHGLVFLLAAAYTLQLDEHVRVDLFYRRMSARARAWVDLLGVAFLLLPTAGFILYGALPYAVKSWVRQETSRETGGMPFPFVPLAKTAIVAMAVLVILQGVAMALRAVMRLRGHEIPPSPEQATAGEAHGQP
jgi:TRAP-type mannitol/chloroaromatic compound transport system permease small subunit